MKTMLLIDHKGAVHKAKIEDTESTITAELLQEICHIKRTKKELIAVAIIPEGITAIARLAFQCFYSLSSCIIPSTVTKIGEFPFNGSSNLRVIFAPKGLVIPDLTTKTGIRRYSGSFIDAPVADRVVYARTLYHEGAKKKFMVDDKELKAIQTGLRCVFSSPENDITPMLEGLKLLAMLHRPGEKLAAILTKILQTLDHFIMLRYYSLFGEREATVDEHTKAMQALDFLTKAPYTHSVFNRIGPALRNHGVSILAGPLFCQLMKKNHSEIDAGICKAAP